MSNTTLDTTNVVAGVSGVGVFGGGVPGRNSGGVPAAAGIRPAARLR
jgi:hypothetical protein